MSIKINCLELENVKRIKAVKLEPVQNGLTVIGGKNGQGKTSVLDSIAWALGGDRFRPSNPERDGSYSSPYLRVELSNGIVVERTGNSSSLKVTCPDGTKAGQKLLDSFVEELALNLPKFMSASNKEKANILLRIIGVGDKLLELDTKEKSIYNERHTIGRIAEQKKKYADELIHHDGLPTMPVSASELIMRQQQILAKNGENARKRERVSELERQKAYLEIQLKDISDKLSSVNSDLELARLSAENLIDINTAELEKDIADIDALNFKIRQNLDKERALMEAQEMDDKYEKLSIDLEDVRAEKIKLLENADLPLHDLSVCDGELTYLGKKWDCLSGAQQLKVATAIVRKLNENCGFVLLDGLEALDPDSLNEFGLWLEKEGLQAISTRVATDDSCTLIIEEGCVSDATQTAETKSAWKEGEF